jgi:hypothetical protein
MLMVIPCGFRLPDEEDAVLLVLDIGRLVVGDTLCVATTKMPPIYGIKSEHDESRSVSQLI